MKLLICLILIALTLAANTCPANQYFDGVCKNCANGRINDAGDDKSVKSCKCPNVQVQAANANDDGISPCPEKPVTSEPPIPANVGSAPSSQAYKLAGATLMLIVTIFQ